MQLAFPKMKARKKLVIGAPGRLREPAPARLRRERATPFGGRGAQRTIWSVEQAHSSEPRQGGPSAILAYLTADTLQKPKLLICLFGRLRQSQDELITVTSGSSQWV